MCGSTNSVQTLERTTLFTGDGMSGNWLKSPMRPGAKLVAIADAAVGRRA
jgi:hypothetical protein